MPSTVPIELTSPTILGGAPDSCDLCHATDFVVARDSTEENCRILICENCRLMYTTPKMTAETLDSFYDDTFVNDPGCVIRAGSDFPPSKDRQKEETLAENWGIKIIKRFIEPRGKRFLDLRCRTGALTFILQKDGADVLGMEPFQANANFAKQVRRLPNIVDIPFSQFHEFPITQDEYFDAINVLPHHVLAHVLSPRRLLEQMFKVLKPGGYLFLDEKDVLHPVRHKKQSPLDSGPAHQYHLTLHATARYIQSTGFSLLECELDKHRYSDFRHIRIVAQKPKEVATDSAFPNQFNIGTGPSITAIRWRLWWLERTWKLRLARIQIKRKSLRVSQKLGF